MAACSGLGLMTEWGQDVYISFAARECAWAAAQNRARVHNGQEPIFGFVRLNYSWGHVEGAGSGTTSGPFDWAELDNIMTVCQQYGIRLMGEFGLKDWIYNPPIPPIDPAQLAVPPDLATYQYVFVNEKQGPPPVDVYTGKIWEPTLRTRYYAWLQALIQRYQTWQLNDGSPVMPLWVPFESSLSLNDPPGYPGWAAYRDELIALVQAMASWTTAPGVKAGLALNWIPGQPNRADALDYAQNDVCAAAKAAGASFMVQDLVDHVFFPRYNGLGANQGRVYKAHKANFDPADSGVVSATGETGRAAERGNHNVPTMFSFNAGHLEAGGVNLWKGPWNANFSDASAMLNAYRLGLSSLGLPASDWVDQS